MPSPTDPASSSPAWRPRSARRVAIIVAVVAGASLALVSPSTADETTTTLGAATSVGTKTGAASTAPGASSTSTTSEPQHWTLAFGGDSLLTRSVSAQSDPFGRIEPPLADADLAIVNVETAISGRGKARIKTYTFRSPPSFAERLAGAGVDVASLANNHALDFGDGAFLDTLTLLQDAGVQPVGGGTNFAEAITPAFREVGGVRVAILAATQVIPPGGWAATSNGPGVLTAERNLTSASTKRLITAVRNARTRSDLVVVVMHWGIERDLCPSAVQKTLGRQLRAAGATIVLGAHPHVLQPIAADETGLVAYSLGNFIWDPRSGVTGETGELVIEFIGAQMIGHTFYPHRLDSNGWAAAVDPDSATGRRIAARVTAHC